ncbi:uncharacterized protein ACNLHF_016731 [Anomaloglossus baeobatrachus]
MSRNKRFKRVIVLSDTEDSCDDVDFHQSRPRKKPIPRSADQDTNTGFNSGPTLDIPDRISTPDPDSNTCSDAVITISDDEDSNIGGIPPCDDNFPCAGEESYAAQHRTPLCNIPGCFLEDIISPNSIYVTDFEVTREELVERLFHHYNSTVFGYQLPKKMAFMWNKSLKTTAGECLQGMKDNQRMSVILLSNRVLDSAERLRSTVAHEMCHAACWIIDGEAFDNHGPLWQAYAKRVNEIHPELPEVTRCHNYTIHYNYYYQCNLCDHKIGRYQKIADAKCYCSRCGGRLRQLSSSETHSLQLIKKTLSDINKFTGNRLSAYYIEGVPQTETRFPMRITCRYNKKYYALITSHRQVYPSIRSDVEQCGGIETVAQVFCYPEKFLNSKKKHQTNTRGTALQNGGDREDWSASSQVEEDISRWEAEGALHTLADVTYLA